MKLCVSSDVVRRKSGEDSAGFRETMIFLKEAGFEEIDYGFDTPHLLRPDWKEFFFARLEEAKRENVRVRYAHLPFDYPGGDAAYGWEEFRLASLRAMELAVRAEVDCAAIHPRTFMTRDYDAAREREASLAFLTFYRDAARDAGLVLALENMRGAGKSAPKEIRRFATATEDLVGLADALEIGICWDTGHANISSEEQEASLSLIGSRLKMVHINDNFAEGDVHIAPFVGSVDWAGVASGLKKAGYRGSLNLEVTCNRLPEELRADYARYMAAAAKHLARMIEE